MSELLLTTGGLPFTPFEGAVVGLLVLLSVVLGVYLWRVSALLRASHTAIEEAHQSRRTLDATASKLKQCARDAEDRLTTATATLERAAQSATRLSDLGSTHLHETSALVRDVSTLSKTTDQMNASLADFRERLNVLSMRDVNEQLTAYPRKIVFSGNRLEFTLTPGDTQHSHLSFGAKTRKLALRLACESRNCVHKERGAESRYVSPVEYHVPGEIDFIASLCHDPKAKEKVDAFFDMLEVSGMVKRGEALVEGLVERHQALAILAVKTTLPLGGIAAPVFLSGVICVKYVMAGLVEALKQNRRDAEATRHARELFFTDPYEVKDMGGPGHVQFGEWIRRQVREEDVEAGKAFGGLTRWLDPATNQFAWLCKDCAYEQIGRYPTL